ncbi:MULTISPECIES: type II secretion system F family protein [Thermomonosporaceae]|uniref:type II secretion system F family protein n=1 Tax=Thermomonosporaceae TaxID=2012 RepID=UPI00255AA188|nr:MULTISPECIES: type II secretion system F family protein [Thermomonosporaceae]MDL4772213.1 type II secretion system F family protein [Actinomadura xylanilytica]
MAVPYPVILCVLAVVLGFAVFGLRDIVGGADQRRRLSARGTLGGVVDGGHGLHDRLDARLRRTAVGRRVARQLSTAGVPVRVSTFVIGLVLAVLLAILVMSWVFAPLFGFISAGLVVVGFFGYLRREEGRRREEFIAQLPELTRVLTNATAAGLVIRTAIEMAAEELEEPARTELTRTAEALRVGQPLDEALRELSDRMPSRELAVLVSTLVVASRSGGSLVTALRNIVDALEQRKETRREVRTIVGGSVVSAYSVVGMGLVSMFGMNFVEPGVLGRMASSLLGQVLLIVAFLLLTVGVVLTRMLSRIEP